MKEYSIGTKCVQAGYAAGNGEPRQIPIIQSTTFKYDTSEDMGKLFDLEAEGYFYSRLQNPTCDTVARKIAAMEGGTCPCSHHQDRQPDFYAMFNICECRRPYRGIIIHLWRHLQPHRGNYGKDGYYSYIRIS